MEMKIMQPITVGGITLKNRIMFPPLTTGYEERDGSIGEQSRAFYTRLAQGGVGYIVLGDVAPIRSFSPTPKLFDDSQIESFRLLADRVHAYGAKLGVQIFHPEYDCDAVNALFAEVCGLDLLVCEKLFAGAGHGKAAGFKDIANVSGFQRHICVLLD